jgi:hypothetical protein
MEFQLLRLRAGAVYIVGLGKEAKHQREYRITGIDLKQTMVATFIHEHDMIAELSHDT